MSGKTMVVMNNLSNLEEVLGETSGSVKDQTSDTVFSSSNNVWQLFGLVFLLIVILVAAYITSKFIAGIKLSQMKDSNFRVIDTYQVSQGKALQIVKIGNKYVVISIGKDNINYITDLDEEEVLIRDEHTGEKPGFKEIFEKLKNNG